MASFLSGIGLGAGKAGLELVRETGQIVVPELEVALDSRARKRGLLGRNALAGGAGLIIAPTNAVHTFFMRFAIDIVFLSRAGQVIKVKPTVRPWRVAAAPTAFAVLELAAGAAHRIGLVRGERLRVRRRESGGTGSIV